MKRYHFLLYCCITFILIANITQNSFADEKNINLYIDADFSNAVSSSTAIEQGIITALSESGNKLGGYAVNIIKLNHRGNSRRSLDNIKQYLADDQALAIFAGLHSPPLLANLKFINIQEALFLVPWAAAEPITRFSGGTNWVFRLSVDDSKAGEVLVGHAVGKRQKRNPALLLEDTGWGKSNAKTMAKALEKRTLSSAGIFWFKWGTKENAARIILRNISNSGADSILMVANAPEGKMFAKAMARLPQEQQLPIFSHWGITGGDFPQIISQDLRQKIDLSFLQTRFSFISNPDDSFGKKVLEQAKKIFPDSIGTASDIHAPTGFIHAYDLTKILVAAVNISGLTGGIKKDRKNIRTALEQLNKPVKGLIKTYSKPFSPFDTNHPDAHEALGIEDFVMARYGKDNEIILLK